MPAPPPPPQQVSLHSDQGGHSASQLPIMPEAESSCHVDSTPPYQHVFLPPKAGSPCTIQASARSSTGLCSPDPRLPLLARSQGLLWRSLTPAQPHQQGPGSAFSSRTQLQTPVSAVASQQLRPGLSPASNQVLPMVRSHTDVGIINEAKSCPTNLQNRSLTKNSTLEPTDDNK